MLAAVALLGTAGLLASRSEGGPRRAAVAPTPDGVPSAPTVASTVPVVVDLSVGDATAYALVGRCLRAAALLCTQDLLFLRSGAWVSTRVPLPPPAGEDGFSARLLPHGEYVTVVEDEASLVYVVEGGVYTRLPLTSGGPAARLPPCGVPELTGGAVSFLDPATGVRHRLAAQPPVGRIRAVAAAASGALFAVGESGSAVLGAVSPDGRRWTAAPVRGLRPGAGVLKLAPDRAGGAYLVVGRDRRPDVTNEFTELWRLTGGRWTDVTPRARTASALTAVVGTGGRLLLTEESGGVWRLQPDGTLLRMPDARSAGTTIKPAYLVSGPAGLLVSAQATDDGRTVLISSADDAASTVRSPDGRWRRRAGTPAAGCRARGWHRDGAAARPRGRTGGSPSAARRTCRTGCSSAAGSAPAARPPEH